MSLTAAIAGSPLLAGKSEYGLKALKGHSAHIACAPTRRLRESIDLEAALKPSLPHAKHWDYAVTWSPAAAEANSEAACFVEVHPANNNHVNDLIEKRNFILGWVRSNARPLLELAAAGQNALARIDPAEGQMFHWIATGASVAFSARSKEGRLLAQAGISGPKRRLVLP